MTPDESISFPSLTFFLELFGVFSSPSHLIVPDTVTESPVFLFLVMSAIVDRGRAAGGAYLNGSDMDVISFTTELLCMKIMPLDATRRLEIEMGCCACCLLRNNCSFPVSSKLFVMTLIIWLVSSDTCKKMSK